MTMRQSLIRAGFGMMGATRLHRVAAPLTRGMGVILMFHHVQPAKARSFSPNGLLEITPSFLEATIDRVRQLGYDITTLDEALDHLRSRQARKKPFAVLTFDDGFRDNRDWALPVLDRLGAPAVFYVTTGFADRTARLWWVELEEAVRRTDRVRVAIGGERHDLPAGDADEKRAAFRFLYWRLRNAPEEELLDRIAELCANHGVDGRTIVAERCLDWAGIEAVAQHPLITVGAHTISHPRLAKRSEAVVRAELAGSRAILESRLGRSVRHLAYPVGDRTSAGRREFEIAKDVGYVSGVTTRPGVIFQQHERHLLALPRLSVNGDHQSLGNLDVLMSGAAFALWNKGRRVNVT